MLVSLETAEKLDISLRFGRVQILPKHMPKLAQICNNFAQNFNKFANIQVNFA